MEAAEALDLLRKSTEAIISGEAAVSVAYSGGLDSSVVAAVAGEFAKIRCYTCVVHESFDARNAKARAESESLELILVELTAEDIPAIVSEAADMLGTSNPIPLAYTIPVLAVLKESRERLVLAGHGADEMFGGYAKYASARNPAQMMAEDLDKMLREGEQLKKAANSLGKRIGFPFVSKELIEFSRSLPLDRKVSPLERKILLREIAKMLGLPSHNLPKKAAQYSSGVLKEMERLAKADGRSLADWTRSLAQRRGRSS
jgi:asparagine synthase (glutamine-hydrolysing)